MKIFYSEEVKLALKKKQPIVALESTIITHGMPYPTNVETAKKVEDTVRANGAIPATIAFIKGDLHIGLSEEELNSLGNDKECVKISRRDIPVVAAKKLSGGTTVATTMIAASMAGIKVFATGGIGGVHKQGNITFDISADLEELGRTNVAVICAGPKAILDIPLTLEYLETKGVSVLGYQTDKLPLFYSRNSEFNVDYRVDSPFEIASIMFEKYSMGLNGGILINNPIKEEYSLDNDKIAKVIKEAQKEADDLEIKGKKLTPFLLAKIAELTKGKSLESNVSLILNNAELAAKIAVEYNKMK